MVNFFITRPIFALVVALVMILAGAVGYVLLPVAQFPEIAPPQVVVSASYGGASAQVVAETVNTVLEQQINGVQGMAYMSSVSANDGTSTITITITFAFNVGYDVDIAAVDVQNRVSQASAQLPAIVNQGGITIQKKQPNFTLMVNIISPDGSVDPVTLSNYAYLQLVDPLKRLPGASDVTIFGEKRYSMRIWLDPDRLARLGVTGGDAQQAILEQNLQVASGKLGQAPSPANKAGLASDTAALRTAALNLSRTEIHAPFAGRISHSQVFEGNLISVAGTTLNTLVKLDPIYVSFSPAEMNLDAIIHAQALAPIEIKLAVGDGPLAHDGTVTVIDNTVDRATGTILLRATIANPDHGLLPGQFVTARLHLGQVDNALLVPQSAVGSGQTWRFLLTVGKDGKVEQNVVKLGDSDGDMVVVTDGLNAGDQVITGQLQKLRPGAPVEAERPGAEPAK